MASDRRKREDQSIESTIVGGISLFYKEIPFVPSIIAICYVTIGSGSYFNIFYCDQKLAWHEEVSFVPLAARDGP